MKINVNLRKNHFQYHYCIWSKHYCTAKFLMGFGYGNFFGSYCMNLADSSL